MENPRSLAPCMIARGTVHFPKDMIRALETLEAVQYTWTVDACVQSAGTASLVKLSADPASTTMIVNGCLFLNVMSFRFLDFAQNADGTWGFRLHGDGSSLLLVTIPETEEERDSRRDQLRLLDEAEVDLETLLALDDEDDDE